MPFGPAPLGFAYFVGVKFVGYSMAGSVLNRACRTTRPRPLVFGAARTALGVAAGVAFGFVASRFSLDPGSVQFLVALAPVRFGEWLLMLWLFYRSSGMTGGLWAASSLCGGLWSYALDLPAIWAMFIPPGGSWVC